MENSGAEVPEEHVDAVEAFEFSGFFGDQNLLDKLVGRGETIPVPAGGEWVRDWCVFKRICMCLHNIHIGNPI